MTDKEVMQMALDALERFISFDRDGNPYYGKDSIGFNATELLRTALLQTELDPVAWADAFDIGREGHDFWVSRQRPARDGVPLYTRDKGDVMKPRKHAELIKAWADGAEIQFRAIPNDGDWLDGDENLIWDDWAEYRIKPEPKPDVVAVGIIELHNTFKPDMAKIASYKTEFHVSEHWEKDNVRITFDGETGKLKKVEVL